MKKESYFGSLLLSLERPVNRVNRFLENHHHLFTLIGVFAALAGYIRTLVGSVEISDEILRLSFFATFGLVLLLVLVAYLRLALVIKKSDFGVRDWENLGLVAFGVVFGGIVSILGYVISWYQELWFALISPIFFVICLTSGMYVVGFVFIFTERIAERTEYSYKKLGLIAESVYIWLAGYLISATSIVGASLWEGFGPGMPVINWGRVLFGTALATSFLYMLLFLAISLLGLFIQKFVPEEHRHELLSN